MLLVACCCLFFLATKRIYSVSRLWILMHSLHGMSVRLARVHGPTVRYAGVSTVTHYTETSSRRTVKILIVFSERELKFRFAICRRPSVCRLSVVCNVRAPYSGDWNFRKCFYAIWYLGHPWPLCNNFTEIVPGEPLHLGLNARGGSQI